MVLSNGKAAQTLEEKFNEQIDPIWRSMTKEIMED
jgi:hypothetical protein